MVIGAIVVMIILVYAYVEITTENPAEQHLLKIKEELNATSPESDRSFKVNYKIF